jgi:hypothetical protein
MIRNERSKMQSKEVMQEIISNPKAGAVVAATTGATGLSNWLELLPPILGIIASVFTITLSGVLIWSHISKTRAEVKLLDRRRQKL